MKYLLAAVNAKYNHMNPAVYLLKACSGAAADETLVSEYTINQYPKDVIIDIYEKNPLVIGFSCYIWNMNFIESILENIKKVLPNTLVILGGPEVSYNPKDVLERNPGADAVMTGEGENAWREILEQIEEDPSLHFPENVSKIQNVNGFVTRDKSGDGLACPNLTNLNEIPFIFKDLKQFENRMIYYESSRGCPFRCSYCLSSIDKKMRFRDLKLVLPELQYFLDANVKLVKFIDRTFNANHDHAMAIWRYLSEHDNNVTRFHFEIEADILTDDEIEFLKTVRAGQFQLEIGVQSTNQQTLNAINRTASIEKIKSAIYRLKSSENIPIHVDLIAGLPYEDMESFRTSFNEVYSWGADELQLGFLKVLHGTEMERRADEYGLVYESSPAYEVISTKWITYADVVHLKEIEEQLERYGNSKAFAYTIGKFESYFSSPFEMYEYIAAYFKEHRDRFSKMSRISAYEMLRDIIAEKLQVISIVFKGWDVNIAKPEHFDALLLLDLYSKEKLKVRPAFLGNDDAQRKLEREYLKGYNEKGSVHVEFFSFDVSAFIESGEIEETQENGCAIVFYYNGQGHAAKIVINNIAAHTFTELKMPVDYKL